MTRYSCSESWTTRSSADSISLRGRWTCVAKRFRAAGDRRCTFQLNFERRSGRKPRPCASTNAKHGGSEWGFSRRIGPVSKSPVARVRISSPRLARTQPTPGSTLSRRRPAQRRVAEDRQRRAQRDGRIFRAVTRVRARGFEVEQVTEFPTALRIGCVSPIGRWSGSLGSLDQLAASICIRRLPWRRALFLVVASDGSVAGYFLVRARVYEEGARRRLRNLHLASLQDWAAFDPALRFEHIVLLAIRELLRWRVDAIEVCVPVDETSPGLRKLGFVRAGSMFTFVKPAEGSALSAPEFATPGAWRLRPAEGDSFFS